MAKIGPFSSVADATQWLKALNKELWKTDRELALYPKGWMPTRSRLLTQNEFDTLSVLLRLPTPTLPLIVRRNASFSGSKWGLSIFLAPPDKPEHLLSVVCEHGRKDFSKEEGFISEAFVKDITALHSTRFPEARILILRNDPHCVGSAQEAYELSKGHAPVTKSYTNLPAVKIPLLTSGPLAKKK
jgi:hypothetical protein